MTNKNPLVSIVVITYNSSKYVLETLESANIQTYQNLELIVSDDASTDNTVEICREWVEKHEDRFVRTKVITVSENTGISANCNRGVRASHGEWVKTIAGDDLIKKECITKYIEFIEINKNLPKFLFSDVNKINSNGKLIDYENFSASIQWIDNFNSKSAAEQYKLLVHSNKVWASTWMFSKEMYDFILGFDERYNFFEDRPFMLKATKNGYKIFFVDIKGAYYRIHENSIQKTNVILSCFEESQLEFLINEVKYDLSIYEHNKIKRKLFCKRILRKFFNNKKNVLVKVVVYLLAKADII